MADEYHGKSNHEYETTVVDGQGRPVETKDRGLFDFMGKKEEKKGQEEVLVTEFDQKAMVSEPEPKLGEYKEDEKKHTSLLEKLHRSDSDSSSSSDEEEGETEEKKKKRKERKEKKGLKEKITGDHEEEEKYEDTTVPVEKYEEETVVHHAEPVQPDENKAFLEKIKEKLPGHTKKTEEIPPPPQSEYAAAELPSQVEKYEEETVVHHAEPVQPEENKGFLEKIKETLPGHTKKAEEIPPPPQTEYAAAHELPSQVEKFEKETVVHHAEPVQPKENKAFLEKIKETLPGHTKKTEEIPPPPQTEYAAAHELPSQVEKYEEETVVHHAEPVQPEENKGFLEKIKETLPGHTKKTEEIPPPPQTEYAAAHELPSQVEKYEEETVVHHAEPVQPEENKGFLEKIKETLPGHPKKTEETPPPPPPQTEYAAAELPSQEGEAKEKKGFLEKIKEKLPGYHPKTEEEKEKAGCAPSHR